MQNKILKAFPSELRSVLQGLSLQFESWDIRGERVVRLNGECLSIPYRVYKQRPRRLEYRQDTELEHLMLCCLYTRHHDGFIRHAMLKKLMVHPLQDFMLPYIFLLLGEYVVEIFEDLYPYVRQNQRQFQAFLALNPELKTITYQRMISYWNVYYRHNSYLNLSEYPAKKIFDLF